MLLAIDAGNTRTKWAAFSSHGEIRLQDACLNSELEISRLANALQDIHGMIISNVAGEAHTAKLKQSLPNNLPTQWLKATANSCNVINRYDNPQSLGCDRWAAIIAGWHLAKNTCVVVSAGTAITIDAIAANDSGGEFIGGLILPGLHLMQQSLGLAAALLPTANVYDDKTTRSIFATNTRDAIDNGTLQAATGAIERMASELNARTRQLPHIVISGGDADLIANQLKCHVTNQVSIVDNLVLQGLYRIYTNEK